MTEEGPKLKTNTHSVTEVMLQYIALMLNQNVTLIGEMNKQFPFSIITDKILYIVVIKKTELLC